MEEVLYIIPFFPRPISSCYNFSNSNFHTTQSKQQHLKTSGSEISNFHSNFPPWCFHQRHRDMDHFRLQAANGSHCFDRWKLPAVDVPGRWGKKWRKRRKRNSGPTSLPKRRGFFLCSGQWLLTSIGQRMEKTWWFGDPIPLGSFNPGFILGGSQEFPQKPTTSTSDSKGRVV